MKTILFTKIVSLTVAGVCILFGTVNYVVDPYGKNGHVQTGFNKYKIIKDERISKFSMLEDYPQATNFIFGSSRGLILKPEAVESLVVGQTLNMSFSSASANEYYLYIKYLFETRKVSNIIIGIDLFAYAVGFESTGTLPQDLRNYYSMDNDYPITNYISLKMFKRSVKAVVYNLTHDTNEIDHRYTDKGQILVTDYLDAKNSEESFNDYINKNVIDKPARWATRHDFLDDDRIHTLSEIKRLCIENGARLHLFMSPLYIKQITIRENKYALQLKLLETIVNNISPVLDFNGVTVVNTTATNFLDEFHYSYDMADSIITQLLTGNPLNEQYKGVFVDQNNLQEYIEMTNRRLQAWYEANAHSAMQ